VVLDEIHLVDGTYRGDQLRILLRRLERLVRHRFSVHLLSATLGHPTEVAERYVSDFEVIVIPGSRELDYFLVDSPEEVLELIRSRGWRKTLWFCNTRQSVEKTAVGISQLRKPYPVVAHHGSLSKAEREEAERVMKEAKTAVCVATSTLEIGIDIGDIDLVVLGDPPLSLSSLHQRVGRGSRRSGRINAAAVAGNYYEKLLLKVWFEAAKMGAMGGVPYIPDRSVVVQQVFSLLYQYPGGLKGTEILEIVSPLADERELSLILGRLEDLGFVEYIRGRWLGSSRTRDMGERGLIHSNIPDEETYTVINAESGKTIGTVSGDFGDVFALAGRIWKVVSIAGYQVKVIPVKGPALPPAFRGRRATGAFYKYLPSELKELDKVTGIGCSFR